MAGLFAARLAAAGHPITMLGTWQTGLQALRQHGVRLVEADGQEHSHPVQVASTPQECGAARYALVLVKAWQTERAARQLAGCLAPDGIAISLQNGLATANAGPGIGRRTRSGISIRRHAARARRVRAGGAAFSSWRTPSPGSWQTGYQAPASGG
jgi:ketopantoate reductase